jgi:arginase
MHGMPLSIVLAEDNQEKKLNKLDDYTVQWGEKRKDCGGLSPKIQYQDLVYVAVRDTEPQEDYLIKRHKIKSYSVTELRKKGVDRIAHEILNQLEDCDLIYISFDIDGLDPKLCPNTGTPVAGGFEFQQAEWNYSSCIRPNHLPGAIGFEFQQTQWHYSSCIGQNQQSV